MGSGLASATDARFVRVTAATDQLMNIAEIDVIGLPPMVDASDMIF
jgi:hypothetical protein